MDLIGNANIKQALEDLQAYPEYKKVLSVLLKNEIYMLLQKLSETGEESIVMTASVSDGSMSVIGSNFGERFVLEPGNAVNLVTGFKEQFALYCHKSAATPPKRARRHAYQRFEREESSNTYPDNDSAETSNAAIKSRLKHKTFKDNRNDIQSPEQKHDNSDKAIDETVSELVKNILKQSEERERELGENGGRRRRRRRRRTFGDQNHLQKGTAYNHRGYRKQKEIRIAQFFPTIPLKRVDSVINNADKQEMFPPEIEVKTEPVDYYFSDMYIQSNFDKKQTGSKTHDRKESFPSESVEKSVDKSIQKIIDMETRSGNSDSDSNNFGNEDLGKDTVEENNDKDEEHIEDKVKRIIAQVSKDSESDKDKTRSEEIYKDNSITPKTVREKTAKQETTKDKESEKRDGEEIDTAGETLPNVNIKGPSTVQIEIDRDEVNFPYEEEFMKNGDEQSEHLSQSFDESGAEDGTDEFSSPSYKRKAGRNFIHNGYSYIRDKAGKGNTVYWKCGRIGCKGRVIQRGGEKIRTQDHNHDPLLELEKDKQT